MNHEATKDRKDEEAGRRWHVAGGEAGPPYSAYHLPLAISSLRVFVPSWFISLFLRVSVVRFVVGLAVVVAAAGWLSFAAPAQRGTTVQPFAKRIKAPAFPAGLKWLNTSGPIELSALRGKFVLLDFWTYCCINCMHILPELKKLEHAYPDTLAVIGVHSAKFEAERDADNITEAILRYHIEHPVINDANHAVWELFGVNAWPTVMLIDPEGYVVWGTSGEVTFEQIDAVLKPALPYYRSRGLLDTTPLHFNLVAAKSKPTPLRFPGKVLADEAGGRLLVADSNHNRIVATRLDGTLLEVIGSGTAGRADGDFATAQFNQPQGMALRGDELFVADTGEPFDPPRRSGQEDGDDHRRHGPPGPGARHAGPHVGPAQDAALQPLGPMAKRRATLYRHGRGTPDLAHAARPAGDRPLRRQRPGRYCRWPAAAQAGVSGRVVVCPAERADLGRRLALRGRQRGEFDPCGAAAARPRGPHRGGHVAAPGRAAFHLRRRGRPGPGGTLAASAGRGLLPRPALRGRHLQQQGQGHRPGDGRDPHAGRRSGLARRAGGHRGGGRQALRGRHEQSPHLRGGPEGQLSGDAGHRRSDAAAAAGRPQGVLRAPRRGPRDGPAGHGPAAERANPPGGRTATARRLQDQRRGPDLVSRRFPRRRGAVGLR